MKLLLHICCAPCLIYPLEELRKKDFRVRGIFYNPNIHPFSEYKNRKKSVSDFSKMNNVDVDYCEYRPFDFFQAVNLKQTSPVRCSLCWNLRLKKTAQVAKQKGFDYFSTTLLVSPYQNHEQLKQIGNIIADSEDVEFYYQDFRPGFKAAHIEAKKQGIYCQKYCGCIYSEIER